MTATSILLGDDVAALGLARPRTPSVARGADAYFKYVNSKGGVHGRTITNKNVDDGVQPRADRPGDAEARRAGQGVRDLQRARHRAQRRDPRLPEREQGAAALRRLRRDDVRRATASKYPYTIGFQPSYQSEGWVLGKYLARTQGAAKVAVLFQNDDYGKDLLNGLKRGIAALEASRSSPPSRTR